MRKSPLTNSALIVIILLLVTGCNYPLQSVPQWTATPLDQLVLSSKTPFLPVNPTDTQTPTVTSTATATITPTCTLPPTATFQPTIIYKPVFPAVTRPPAPATGATPVVSNNRPVSCETECRIAPNGNPCIVETCVYVAGGYAYSRHTCPDNMPLLGHMCNDAQRRQLGLPALH